MADDALARVEAVFRIHDSDYYREHLPAGQLPYATVWPLSMLHAALIVAAERDRKQYLPLLYRFQRTLSHYWDDKHHPPGFDAYPNGKDKYYDDNAWLTLNYLRLYELTSDRMWLHWAELVHRFVWSGWDEQLGGGIYWHQNHQSKNTCSNAPALVGALWLYHITRKPEYLQQAKRIHQWLFKHLQDPEDGLFWDHVRMDGSIDRTKFSYNTALVIRACLWWHRLTGYSNHLNEATRLATASQRHWFKGSSRSLEGDSAFVVKLCEAFWQLSLVTGESRWQVLVERTGQFVLSLRSQEGDYPDRWYAGAKAQPPYSLMAIASAACVYGILSTPRKAWCSLPPSRKAIVYTQPHIDT